MLDTDLLSTSSCRFSQSDGWTGASCVTYNTTASSEAIHSAIVDLGAAYDPTYTAQVPNLTNTVCNQSSCVGGAKLNPQGAVRFGTLPTQTHASTVTGLLLPLLYMTQTLQVG